MTDTSVRVENEVLPTRPEQLALMREPGPDGPIVMVNLLKFRDRAVYDDGRVCDLTGREAYDIYGNAVGRLIYKHGGKVLFAGNVTALSLGFVDPLWEEIALAQYPNRAALVAMSMSAEWRDIAVHRSAGLLGQLNIETVYTPGFAAMMKAMG